MSFCRIPDNDRLLQLGAAEGGHVADVWWRGCEPCTRGGCPQALRGRGLAHSLPPPLRPQVGTRLTSRETREGWPLLTVETFTSFFKGRGLAHGLPPPLRPRVGTRLSSWETREGWPLLTAEIFKSFFPKIKCPKKKSQNSRNQGFSYFFCLMIEGSGSIPLTDGSGSRSGSRRPKNMRIRIRIRIRITGGLVMPAQEIFILPWLL